MNEHTASDAAASETVVEDNEPKGQRFPRHIRGSGRRMLRWSGSGIKRTGRGLRVGLRYALCGMFPLVWAIVVLPVAVASYHPGLQLSVLSEKPDDPAQPLHAFNYDYSGYRLGFDTDRVGAIDGLMLIACWTSLKF